MKKFLLSLSVIAVFSLRAQYTITSASAPVAGEINSVVQTNTAGLAMPATGTGKFWNYTSVTLNTLSVSSNTIVPISSVPNASLYPGATIAEEYPGGNYSVYKNNSSSWIYMGDAAATPSDCNVFSDPLTMITLPFSYNSSFTDNFAMSNTNYTVTGNLSMLGSGTGTLAVPGFTFTNVLMITQSYTQNINFVGGMVVARGTDYSFHSAVSKASLFSVGTSTQTQGTSTIITVSSSINKAYTVLGIDETSLDNFLSVYPNPVTGNAVTIGFINYGNTQINTSVINLMGQKVAVADFDNLSAGENSLKIDLSSLSPGIYYLQVKMGETQRVRKIVIE